MAHWLITGGAGFIGSHLAGVLARGGDRITVLDNLSTGKRANLEGIPGLTLIEDELADRARLAELARDADGIFHLAARVSVPDCIAHWRQGHSDNLIGAMNVFDAACSAGEARPDGRPVPVVYASSAAVYGDCGDGRCHEGLAPQPISPYGADKMACEHQARAFAHVHGLPSFGLRLFNAYGPGQDASSPYAGVIARFSANILAGAGHVLHGDGRQARDFIFVEDAVEMMRRAMARLAERPARAEVSNLCTGRATTLLELVAALDEVRGSTTEVSHRPARSGDIYFSCGDPTRMTQLLGPLQAKPLSQGLAAALSGTVNA